MKGGERAKRPALTASQAVRNEWLARVEAEYRSAAIANHLTLWLMQIGASPDLVRAGLRIVDDEMTHAELSHRTYTAAGGTGAPAIPRESLELRRRPTEPLEYDVVRAGVNVFCLGETVAVPLFKDLREGCTVPVARRALDRILRDEVRHRDFGWAVLEGLFALPIAHALRALASHELPGYFHRLRQSYGAAAKGMIAIPVEDRAWGLMPPAEYASAVERTLERDWIPRFGRVGIDAQKAWNSGGA